MAECCYPRCYSCKLDFCIKDNVIQPKENEYLDRSDYQKEYYEKTKEKRKENYNAQTQYLRWVDVKKTLNSLKKQIGTNNYELIMAEISKLEKSKYG